MAFDREEVVAGLVAELWRFRELVSGLTDAELSEPTRCPGWSVFDVAAHVTGVTADIGAGQLDGIDTQPWYDRQVAERRGRSGSAIVDELQEVIPPIKKLFGSFDDAAWNGPGVPGVDGSLGDSIHSLWCGVYIHAEDILAALGRPPLRGPGLAAAVGYIVKALSNRGWGPATLALDDLGELEIGGGGRRIETDALTFTLAVSGRADPSPLGLDPSVNIYG